MNDNGNLAGSISEMPVHNASAALAEPSNYDALFKTIKSATEEGYNTIS